MQVARRGYPVMRDTVLMTEIRRPSSRCSPPLLAAAGLCLSAGVVRADETPQWRYTLVGFSNDSARDMDVYESADGSISRWCASRHLPPPTGYVRDPSIMRHADGRYYVVYHRRRHHRYRAQHRPPNLAACADHPAAAVLRLPAWHRRRHGLIGATAAVRVGRVR